MATRSTQRRALVWCAAAGLALTAATPATTARAVPPDEPHGSRILHRGGPGAITSRYLVQFKDGAVQQQDVDPTAASLSRRYGGKTLHTYKHALRGFAVELTEKQAEKLATEPAVRHVEQSRRGYAIDTQTNPPSWSTDRVDQRDLPLNQRYDYPSNAGQGVTVYVLDTGMRATHQDFTGRVGAGRDFVDNDNDPSDCHGHGTHVAGSAVGTSYGLAKKAEVVALRVLNCFGSGYDSDFIEAIDWVKANAVKPAVVNYSIGCRSACSIETLDNAVKSLIASGVQWVQAAGNSNDNACNYSPQKVPEAVTVGNTNQQDGRYVGTGTSSYGPCLDIWAPGTSVVSASYSSDTGSATMTGTSMASPHVAGAAALYLGSNPSATPQQVRDALVGNSTPDKVTNAGTGSPTNLLYTGFIQPGTNPTVANPGNQTSTVGTPVSLDNSASGGSPPYTWSATGLPVGLSINASTGTISGTPTTAGSSSVTITATDSAGKSGNTMFSWTVNPSGEGGDLTNGGFEAGSLSGWTTGGTGNAASVVNTGAHGGSYAARLGSTTATNGESTISQTFTAGSGASQLSFWYSMTCPDTVTYAWARATLRDNTSSTTTTPLAKTCTNGQGWKQVTAALTTGHSYTLTLVNRDDNHPDDPVSTLFDDVSTDGRPPGPGPGGLQKVSSDTYTNTDSQHATQVESDSFAAGSTIVAAFQTGRYTNGGASNIAWSTSTDGGGTWRTGNLRGLTVHDGGANDRATDPVVAYSVKHGTWLIGTTPLDESGGSARGLGMQVLRSSDGSSWSSPVTAIAMNDTKNYDKNALGCDNTPSSPHYGNCYAAIDIFSQSNQLVIAKSDDGGQTWGPAMQPSGVTGTLPNGVATLPNGTVVVLYDRVSGGNNQMVTRSTDGGNTWSGPINISDIQWHQPNGGLRGNPMPDIDVDGSGKLYVTWPDSRFRSGTANDIVYTTSTDGQTWTSPARIPIDPTSSGVEHYFPELAVDITTAGSSAKIGLYYYFYDNANCSSASSCQLKVGYISSTNGGTSWSGPQTLAGPYPLTQIANTSSGRMIGDYSAGSIVDGRAVGVFSVGKASSDGKAFDQAMYSYGPQAITGGTTTATGDTPAPARPGRSASTQDLRLN